MFTGFTNLRGWTFIMGKIGQQLLLQLILILLNSFFAAAEIAVISLNDAKVKKLAESGDKKAATMLKMVEEPNGFLSTIQVCITLAGFLGSAFAADTFSDMLVGWMVRHEFLALPENVLNSISVVIITIILSYFTLVLGELVPKRIAMRNPDKLARAVCGFIAAMSTILKPIVWLLSKSTNLVLRIFRINPNEIGEDVTEDDIRVMIDAAEEKGDIDADSREMLENVFEFDDISAGDVMVHRTDMTVIYDTDTTEEILSTIVESGYSRLPVCSETIDQVIGLVRTRELLLALREKDSIDIREVMQDVFFVPETIKANRLLQEMKKNKSHMAVVVDEFGGTAGLVTMEDLLETIVGDIYDETDKEEPNEIEVLSEDSWRISGNTAMEDVEELIHMDLPLEEEEYNTFGGFIIANLSYIPHTGDHPRFDYGDFSVCVEQVGDRRIEWAKVVRKKSENLPDAD